MDDNISSHTTEVQAVVTFESKERIEREYRDLLFDDLMNGRTKFSAGPYEAHIQFSNFCNMSCIMCWDGNNPKTRKTDASLLDRIGEQLGPHLSVVTPYSGSEPLVLTWDETREMAKKYGILLCITTNVQFLDEEKFHELKDIAETLILSIDSHIPAVFEKIRPRSNSKKVFDNLETAVRLSVENNLECIINVVFMTQNAPMLTDTLNYFADLGVQNVNVIQLLDVNANSRMYDPLIHYSEEYVAWIKKTAIATAKQRKFRLIWSVSGYAEFDFREPGFIVPKSRKQWNDDWDEQAKLFFPGFCRNAYGRLRVDSDGDISPCCYATQGELSLGNIQHQDFDEIWNSTEAQDLRRGMFSGDVPALCKSCRYHDLVKPFSILPFVETVESEFVAQNKTGSEHAIASLELLEPVHGHRAEDAITIKIRQPAVEIKEYWLAVSLGGQTVEIHQEKIVPNSIENEIVEFEVPAKLFESLKTNVGYWWMVWGMPSNYDQKPLRCHEVRCLIRHKELVRLEGSTLRYLDQGFVPVSDLGGNKESGWKDPNHLPARPVAAFHGRASADESSVGKAEIQTEIQTPVNASQPNANRPTPAATSNESSEPGFLKRMFGSKNETKTEAGILDAYLEVFSQQTDALQVSGWLMFRNGAADTVEFVGEDGHVIVASVQQRADIAEVFVELDSAINSGFGATLSDEHFWHKDRYRFSIIAKRNGRIEFRCNVTCPGGQNGVGSAHSIRNGVLDVQSS